MITLLTGLPGNGKGVYSIDYWKRKAELEGRVVYYSGIAECRVPGWVELDDPTQWHTLPAGAMILIDECQRYFRPRANGAAVPEYVAKLETHRHNGYDILLITQHPMLVDQNIRRLVGQHFHIVRRFGMQAATVHEWAQVIEQPHKTRRDSIKHNYSYNTEIYGLYKSAEVHTVKRNIPARLIIFPLLIIGIPALIYGAYHFLNPDRATERITGQPASEQEQGGLVRRSQGEPKLSWYEQQAPRVATLPATAPKYDDVVKPVRAPRPAACVLMRGECRCYTQQATRMRTDDSLCRQIVENGYFLDYDDQPLPKDNNPPQYQTTEQTVLQPEAAAGGETVGPASADVPAEPEGRSPSKVARDRMASSSHAFEYPGAIVD